MRHDSSQFVLREYRRADRGEVFDLLHALPVWYPGGDAWLSQRLNDTLRACGWCTLILNRDRVIAISIETPKRHSEVKLSTFFVHSDFRRQGVGSVLLANSVSRWRGHHLHRSYVT